MFFSDSLHAISSVGLGSYCPNQSIVNEIPPQGKKLGVFRYTANSDVDSSKDPVDGTWVCGFVSESSALNFSDLVALNIVNSDWSENDASPQLDNSVCRLFGSFEDIDYIDDLANDIQYEVKKTGIYGCSERGDLSTRLRYRVETGIDDRYIYFMGFPQTIDEVCGVKSQALCSGDMQCGLHNNQCVPLCRLFTEQAQCTERSSYCIWENNACVYIVDSQSPKQVCRNTYKQCVDRCTNPTGRAICLSDCWSSLEDSCKQEDTCGTENQYCSDLHTVAPPNNNLQTEPPAIDSQSSGGGTEQPRDFDKEAFQQALGDRYKTPEGYEGILPDCAFRGDCNSLNDLLVLGVNVGKFVFRFIGAAAFVMFIAGGFFMIVSFGNAERFKQGRDILVAAVIGMIIAFGAYILVSFILEALQVSDYFLQ